MDTEFKPKSLKRATWNANEIGNNKYVYAIP